MMTKVFAPLLVVISVMGASSPACATLELRGEGTSANGTHRLIYDTDLDITWYDYTASYDNWDNQMDWVSSLTVDFGGASYTDWRLPTAMNRDGTGPCQGSNCTGSEVGHLYYTELGNWAYPSAGYGLVNTGDFQNLKLGYYWSDTEHSDYPDFAWIFSTVGGSQDYDGKSTSSYAIAVRPGDITMVPEPFSSTIFLIGGALFLRRKYVKWYNLQKLP